MSSILELNNITKIFNKDTVNEATVFDNFNLSVEEGEFVSIVGSNGSGKTTLLNIISGNIPIEYGSVVLKGNNITKQPEYIRAKRIGRVFQDPAKGTANTMTIAENLALAENKGKPYGLSRGLNKKKISEYQDLVRTLNLGLEDKINVEVGSLSGGQRQALTLLMATMTPIDLLLLDEHTAALDPKTSQDIMDLTNRIVNEKHITTLMVTHNLRFAVEYGSRLMMFNKGTAVIDKAGEEKQKLVVDDLLKTFNEISIECGN